MKALLDTSVLVAAVVQAHPQHGRALPWLARGRRGEFQLFVASHTLAEMFAVLTTLPVKPRISPSTAWRLVSENVARRRAWLRCPPPITRRQSSNSPVSALRAAPFTTP